MTTAECQISKSAAVHTLLDLLEQRKTRRFGCGMELPAGPLRYQSTAPPIPLSQEETRYLLFAGVGETGRHLADMQYASRPGREDGQGMAIMNFQGRTTPSACAANTTKLFLSNDEGVYFAGSMSHPESGVPPELIPLQQGRLEIPRQLPYMLSFNQWYTNRPGTLYILPVTEVARVYLNLLLVLLSEEYGYFIVDSDHGNSGCGLDLFRRSRGGHLHDDPATNRVMTLRELDAAISDTALQEQGMVCQNMFLMAQAMGLGGGIQSVGSGRHLLGLEPRIFPGLGFHFANSPVSGVRANPMGVANLWEGPCPPFVSSIEEAVLNLVESKFGAGGIYTSPASRPWITQDGRSHIASYDPRAIDAVIHFCNYVYKTYGRFPAHADAFKTVIAFQAHHLDVSFYDKFYPNESVPQTHRDHLAAWHHEHPVGEPAVSLLHEGVHP
ncbi:MAG: hypothetical protein NTX84_12360 [Nitrospirae bacterium]|nr:hypothetical protein [Nitrospirota bacterium]